MNGASGSSTRHGSRTNSSERCLSSQAGSCGFRFRSPSLVFTSRRSWGISRDTIPASRSNSTDPPPCGSGGRAVRCGDPHRQAGRFQSDHSSHRTAFTSPLCVSWLYRGVRRARSTASASWRSTTQGVALLPEKIAAENLAHGRSDALCPKGGSSVSIYAVTEPYSSHDPALHQLPVLQAMEA